MIQENVMGVDRSVHVCHDLHAMYNLIIILHLISLPMTIFDFCILPAIIFHLK